MKQNLELNVEEAWEKALESWNRPRIPYIIAASNGKEIENLGEIGGLVVREYAFMKYPEFQTYANLTNIANTFQEDSQRGLNALMKHEIGHRFCPYDLVAMIIMQHDIKKALDGIKLPYNADDAAATIMNLFTDMCINTRQNELGDKDIAWAYSIAGRKNKWKKSKLFKVYGRSMEHAWNEKIFDNGVEFKQLEEQAAKKLAEIFNSGGYFHRYSWRENAKNYARIIANFLEDNNKDRRYSMDNIAGNSGHERKKKFMSKRKKSMPKMDDKTKEELAKRIAEIGQDGMPSNKNAMKEFQEILAGMEQGDAKKANISFYDMLSNSYDVMFAERPFGIQRTNPFQPIKWQPEMDINKLDVNYSVQLAGRIIPGVNTYAWNTRKREEKHGVEQVVPNLELFLDSSGSMPNPINNISLPVLSGFVVSKKAFRKNAKVRAINFSGHGQYSVAESGNNLRNVFENLVTYYNGGTILPVDKLQEHNDPKQVVVITDTYLHNYEDVAQTIEKLIERDKRNKITIYATVNQKGDKRMRDAGAEIIYGTDTDIFRKVIGKVHEVYDKR